MIKATHFTDEIGCLFLLPKNWNQHLEQAFAIIKEKQKVK